MGNKIRYAAIILLAFMLMFNSAIPAFASGETIGETIGDTIGETMLKYTADNGNMVVIDDSAELLSESEKEHLLENMKTVTEYGHAAFITILENDYSAEKYAKSIYFTLFGEQSGTLFLIDMDNRMIQFYSDGKFAKTINNTRSNEIADNIYKYASNEKYFECANEAFNQVLILLKGGKISTPMRHVTNVLMAACLGLLLNFLRVLFNRKRNVSIKKIDKNQVIKGGYKDKTDFIKNVNSKMISQKKKRHSDSSSGGGSDSGGGGGGGGGSSGGHSF
ncbi:MAG: TPM domain-containing protein [Clostridiaceae bacterium]|nr:TPM domain-containing protein [Clostridiaceae bacterium]